MNIINEDMIDNILKYISIVDIINMLKINKFYNKTIKNTSNNKKSKIYKNYNINILNKTNYYKLYFETINNFLKYKDILKILSKNNNTFIEFEALYTELFYLFKIYYKFDNKQNKKIYSEIISMMLNLFKNMIKTYELSTKKLEIYIFTLFRLSPNINDYRIKTKELLEEYYKMIDILIKLSKNDILIKEILEYYKTTNKIINEDLKIYLINNLKNNL